MDFIMTMIIVIPCGIIGIISFGCLIGHGLNKIASSVCT